jgi:His-Xaa-Ser system protein HxsD
MQLELDADVYALEAVQKAGYRFINRLTVVVSKRPGTIVCEIDGLDGRAAPSEATIADFKRELLDQQLRVQIKAETESVRNLILAYTFSESKVAQ